jgi:hypothetical protein
MGASTKPARSSNKDFVIRKVCAMLASVDNLCPHCVVSPLYSDRKNMIKILIEHANKTIKTCSDNTYQRKLIINRHSNKYYYNYNYIGA